MKKFYDKNLKRRLKGNNPHSDIVLNRKFNEWSSHLVENLDGNQRSGDDWYRGDLDQKLLSICQEHEKRYEKSKWGDKTIMLTHPFYLSLTHMSKLENKEVKKESQDYLDNLIAFLKLDRTKSKLNVIVLETLHHYAAATSLLLENGLIDKVIFTQYDSGFPLDYKDIQIYHEDEIYFGGGYNERCLNQSIRRLKEVALESRIWAIKELVLSSPHDHITLKVSKVEGLPQDKILALEEVKKRLDLSKI